MTYKALNTLLNTLTVQYSGDTKVLDEISRIRGVAQSPELPHLVEATCGCLQLAFALHPTDTLKTLVAACLQETLSWKRRSSGTALPDMQPGVVLVRESDSLFERWQPAVFQNTPSSDSADVREAVRRYGRCYGSRESRINTDIAQIKYPNSEEVLRGVEAYLDDNDPSEVVSYLILSLFLATISRYERAAKCADGAYRVAITSGRDAEATWANQAAVWCYTASAEALDDASGLGRAEEAYKRLLELKPEDAMVWAKLAELLRESGRPVDARVAFERALQLDPKIGHAWTGVAQSYADDHDFEKAESVLREGIRIFGNSNPDFHVCLGLVQAQTDRTPAAKSAFERAISLEPGFLNAWFNLGVVRRDLGDDAGAMEAFHQASALGSFTALLGLIGVRCTLGLVGQAAICLGQFLQGNIKRFREMPLVLAKEFGHLRKLGSLAHYELATACDVDQPPGTGRSLVDQYLMLVQQALIEGLKIGELRHEEVAAGLLHIVALWCLYGMKLAEKGLSRAFVREQVYAIEHQIEHLPEETLAASGFASAWPELRARTDTTSDQEFAQEMLTLERAWLASVGRSQDHGQIQDLRWRLKGNLWVHLFEYQRKPTDDHLERVHYYMELLKGHTVLHKLADTHARLSEKDRQTWNRYVASLPVKVDRTMVADLRTCTAHLNENAIGLSFYFLQRDLLPTLLVGIVLRPGSIARLTILDGGDRLKWFQDVATRLKLVHQEAALREKTHGVGESFCRLVGQNQKQSLSGRALTKAISNWERDQLRKAYGAVLEGVIDVEELRGKDLYVSLSPEMYDIPFGLLLNDDEFLGDIANSITIVPIFSLRRFEGRRAIGADDFVLCLDPRWRDVAELRGKSISDRWPEGIRLTLESDLSASSGDFASKYDRWLRTMDGRCGHVIGHHEPNQWARPTSRKPNLGQFGRYLYEAPAKLSVDLLSLEACWAGTWSDPESLMGLFVSFLATGASQLIASPYPLVPTETSGRLFEKIYGALQLCRGERHAEVATAITKAAQIVGRGDHSIEDTIPTLWGALQSYAAL
jgi:tetratricopeptide (TPR) repeat protein